MRHNDCWIPSGPGRQIMPASQRCAVCRLERNVITHDCLPFYWIVGTRCIASDWLESGGDLAGRTLQHDLARDTIGYPLACRICRFGDLAVVIARKGPPGN